MRKARSRLEIAVQDERIEIGAVGPYNGPQLIVDTSQCEVIRVGERLEHGATQLSGEIYIA